MKNYSNASMMIEDFRNLFGEKVMNKFINETAALRDCPFVEYANDMFCTPDRFVSRAFWWGNTKDGVSFWRKCDQAWMKFLRKESTAEVIDEQKEEA